MIYGLRHAQLHSPIKASNRSIGGKIKKMAWPGRGQQKSVNALLIIALLMGIGIMGWYLVLPAFTGRRPMSPFAQPNGPSIGPSEVATGEPFYGPISLKMDTQDVYDASVLTTEPTVRIWDSKKEASLSVTLDGSTATVFTLQKEDKGIAYLTADWGTGTGSFIYQDKLKEYSRNYITAWEPWDWDKDGILEWSMKLDFSSLAPLAAGETAKSVQFNLAGVDADTAVDITSQANVTSVSTSAYTDYYATGYISGLALGSAIKVSRMYLVYGSTADNDTYVDNGNVKLVDITMGWPSSGGGSISYSGTKLIHEDANDRWKVDIGVTDINNEYYGILNYRDRGVGDTAITYSIHILAKFAASSKVWYPYLQIDTINPASTLTSLTQYVSYTS